MTEQSGADCLFEVADRTVLVTGGVHGLGRAITEAFHARGATVIATTRRDAEKATGELSELGSAETLRVVEADLSSDDDIEALGRRIAALTPTLDVVVNNAGTTWGAPLESYPAEAWRRVLDVDVAAPFKVVQAVLPLLEAAAETRPPARIINIGSVDGHAVGSFDNFAYGAAKAGIHHLTRALAVELGPRQITVNCVAPGPVRTRMTRALFEDGDRLAATNPLRRLGEVDDVVGSVVFLAAPASSYINGATIAVDGGFAVGRWGTP